MLTFNVLDKRLLGKIFAYYCEHVSDIVTLMKVCRWWYDAVLQQEELIATSIIQCSAPTFHTMPEDDDELTQANPALGNWFNGLIRYCVVRKSLAAADGTVLVTQVRYPHIDKIPEFLMAASLIDNSTNQSLEQTGTIINLSYGYLDLDDRTYCAYKEPNPRHAKLFHIFDTYIESVIHINGRLHSRVFDLPEIASSRELSREVLMYGANDETFVIGSYDATSMQWKSIFGYSAMLDASFAGEIDFPVETHARGISEPRAYLISKYLLLISSSRIKMYSIFDRLSLVADVAHGIQNTYYYDLDSVSKRLAIRVMSTHLVFFDQYESTLYTSPLDDLFEAAHAPVWNKTVKLRSADLEWVFPKNWWSARYIFLKSVHGREVYLAALDTYHLDISKIYVSHSQTVQLTEAERLHVTQAGGTLDGCAIGETRFSNGRYLSYISTDCTGWLVSWEGDVVHLTSDFEKSLASKLSSFSMDVSLDSLGI